MKLARIIKSLSLIIILCMQPRLLHSIPMTEWDSILQSNKKFVKSRTFSKQRTQLENEQNPPVIVLSCSDSRVPPEFVFNKKLGELFVIRVAGHVVDDLVIDSIEYAVHSHDSHVIVVLGHSGCGAVTGALKEVQKNGGVTNKPRGKLGAVLMPIEKAIVESGMNVQGANALEEAIQAQVKYAASQLVSRSRVIADAVASGELIVVGAEYFLNTGHIDQLFITSSASKNSKNK